MAGLSPLHHRRTPPRHMVERGPGDGPKPHHTWHYLCGFGPSEGEARNPPARPLSFPHPPLICPTDGDWQLQDLPGAPGTARQGRTRIIVSTNDGGVATQPRAPGHGRPLAAQRAARHGRLSADSGAPGADVPLATTARAPGQHCLSAAPRAPGHEQHPAAAQRAAGHDRLSVALQAPDDDAPLAATASLPSHHRPSAAPIATVPLPAGVHRLCQGFLPRVPANPRTLIYPHSDRLNRHSRFRGNPRPPVATGGPQGGYAPATCVAYSQIPTRLLSHTTPSSFPRKRESRHSHHTTHQVHPAVQVPPHPRPCSTACTGFPRHHPSRAPPPRHCGASRNPAPSPSTAGGEANRAHPPTTDQQPILPNKQIA